MAGSLENIGHAWKKLGNIPKAIDYYEQCLAIEIKVYGEEHANVASSLNNIGYIWYTLGEQEKALDYHEQRLAIVKKVHDEEHPDVAASLINLGCVWCRLGDVKKGAQYLEKALTIFVTKSEDSPYGVVLCELGHAYTLAERLDEALPTLEKAKGILHQQHGGAHFQIAITLKYFAQAHHAKGEHPTALKYAKEALTMTREVQTKRHPDEAACLQVLGEIYLSLNKISKTQAALKKAFVIYQKRFGDDNPKTKAAFKAWQASLNEAVQSNQPTPLTLSLTSFAARTEKSTQQTELTTLIKNLNETGRTLSYQCQNRQCIITVSTVGNTVADTAQKVAADTVQSATLDNTEQEESLDADNPEFESLRLLKNKLQAAIGEMGIKDITTQNNQIIITALSDTKIVFIEKLLQQLVIKEVNKNETSDDKTVEDEKKEETQSLVPTP